MKGQNPTCAGTSDGFWNSWHTALWIGHLYGLVKSVSQCNLLVWWSSALVKGWNNSVLFKVLTENRLSKFLIGKLFYYFKVCWYFGFCSCYRASQCNAAVCEECKFSHSKVLVLKWKVSDVIFILALSWGWLRRLTIGNSRASMMQGKVVPLKHCVASAVSATLNSGVPFPWLKWWCAIVSIGLQSDCSALIPELSEQLAIFNHTTAKQSALWHSWRREQMCAYMCSCCSALPGGSLCYTKGCEDQAWTHSASEGSGVMPPL